MAIGRVKEFYLYRIDDETGTSGAGVVARGAVLISGKAALEWSSFHTSFALYDNLQVLEDLHGHNGKTRVVIGNPDDVHEEFIKELKKEQKKVPRRKKGE